MDENIDRPNYEPADASSFPPEPIARLSSIQRLTKMFFSPGEVFEDIKAKPTWALALAAYIIVVTATSLVVWNNIDFDASTREAISSIGFEVPEEQIEKQIESSEQRWFLKPILTGVIFMPIVLVIAAAMFFLMMKMVGSDMGFLATYSTMLHAYWPGKAVYSVLLAVMAQTQGPTTEMGLVTLLKSSVAGFLPQGSSLAMITLGSFVDVFRIWGIVLLVIGLATVGRVSKGKATFAALAPWIFAVLVSTGLAILPSLFVR